jgi:hypothetical protein
VHPGTNTHAKYNILHTLQHAIRPSAYAVVHGAHIGVAIGPIVFNSYNYILLDTCHLVETSCTFTVDFVFYVIMLVRALQQCGLDVDGTYTTGMSLIVIQIEFKAPGLDFMPYHQTG